MKSKKVIMVLEKTSTGFSAYSPVLPIYTTGSSMAELLDNAYEATNLYFEEEAVQITREDIRFEVDFRQFFQYYRVINASFLAERIGMNPTLLSQYVQGRKKPSEAQKNKILAGIQQIGRELSEISFLL